MAGAWTPAGNAEADGHIPSPPTGGNPLDNLPDFLSGLCPKDLCGRVNQRGLLQCSNTWCGRAQGGVAELGPFGNNQGVICQTVTVSHYSFQSHKPIDKTAVNYWKNHSAITHSKK